MPNKTERLGREPITPLLLNLALPSLAGLLISNLYLIFNRIFVGQAVGSLGLAAMNATMPISMIIFAIAILIGRGSSVLYSIALGARKYGEAQKLFGLSMALFLSASLLITVGGLLFLDDLLYFFGATDAVLSYGRSYLSISLLGTLFIMLGFQNNLIRAEGFSGLAMMTQLIGAGLNVVLDYFFVWHFNWGMSGAATATGRTTANPTNCSKPFWRSTRMRPKRRGSRCAWSAPATFRRGGSTSWLNTMNAPGARRPPNATSPRC